MQPTTANFDKDANALLFLHIPKTAGSTFNRILERQADYNNLFILHTSKIDRFSMSLDEFDSLPEAKRRNIRIIRGHFGYGPHCALPQGHRYVTIMRRPVDLVVSAFFHNKTVTTDLKYLPKEGWEMREMTLHEALVEHKSHTFNNIQTRMISGVHNSTPIGDCPPSMLEKAKTNILNDFAMVGLTEQFDATLLLCKKLFGWNRIFYTRKRVAKNKPEIVLDETLALINEYNELDIQLYAFAEQLLVEQLASFGVTSSDVADFQRQNLRFGMLETAYWLLYRKSGQAARSIKGLIGR